MNKRPIIVTVANQKGGVGKTTVSRILGSILQRDGHRVLFIDADPQFNLSAQFNANISAPGIYAVMIGEAELHDVIQKAAGYDIVAASARLSAIDAELARDPYGMMFRLRETIDNMPNTDIYDFIIIDTPPALGVMCYNALIAADELIIPTDPDVDGISGIVQLANNVNKLKKSNLSHIHVNGIVFNRVKNNCLDPRILAMAERMAQTMDTTVYGQRIRPAKLVSDAKVAGKDLIAGGSGAMVINDFWNLKDEFLSRIQVKEA